MSQLEPLMCNMFPACRRVATHHVITYDQDLDMFFLVELCEQCEKEYEAEDEEIIVSRGWGSAEDKWRDDLEKLKEKAYALLVR